MRWSRTWSGRLLVGAVLGVLIVLVWIRREAHIATTPVSIVATTASSVPLVIPSAVSLNVPVGENEVGESRSPARAGSLDSTRDRSQLVQLNVPFVSQAPFRVWDLPYKEFCEEASVLSLHYWKRGRRTPPADELDRAMKEIQAWETANLRTWEDTTVEETARVLREKFGHANTRVVRNVTIADITRELDAGRPIIVPAAGRELASPYYRPPGPLYHMLVIIGYDERTHEFITNDVGTNTKGAGFRFTYDDLYGAMGDWDVALGAPDTTNKAMIVVE